MSQMMWHHHVASCLSVIPKGRYCGNNWFIYHMMFFYSIIIKSNATITAIMILNVLANYTSIIDFQLTINVSNWLHVSNWPSSRLFIWADNYAIDPALVVCLFEQFTVTSIVKPHISTRPSSRLLVWVVNYTKSNLPPSRLFIWTIVSCVNFHSRSRYSPINCK